MTSSPPPLLITPAEPLSLSLFPACEQEREENVKADVFHAYLSLLKQTRPAQSWLADPDAMEQGETPLTMLQSQVTLLLRQTSRHQ